MSTTGECSLHNVMSVDISWAWYECSVCVCVTVVESFYAVSWFSKQSFENVCKENLSDQSDWCTAWVCACPPSLVAAVVFTSWHPACTASDPQQQRRKPGRAGTTVVRSKHKGFRWTLALIRQHKMWAHFQGRHLFQTPIIYKHVISSLSQPKENE